MAPGAERVTARTRGVGDGMESAWPAWKAVLMRCRRTGLRIGCLAGCPLVTVVDPVLMARITNTKPSAGRAPVAITILSRCRAVALSAALVVEA